MPRHGKRLIMSNKKDMNFLEMYNNMDTVLPPLNVGSNQMPVSTPIPAAPPNIPPFLESNWGNNRPEVTLRSTSDLPISEKKEPPEENGIFFARHLVLSTESEYFAAVFGGTASGKTSIVMKNTLLRTWLNPFVAIDIKGDLCPEYEKCGNPRKAVVLSFRNEIEYTYDPLEYVRQGRLPVLRNLFMH
jgi:hypothetical protein